ncbi:MAG TPA: hypothetical protein VLG37_03195 [Candidatus Saccharimonadales bacterium]|nr:hypothetical protein [Candidatus Saccharimonadales bacterium]
MAETLQTAPERHEAHVPVAEKPLELTEHSGETAADVEREQADQLETIRRSVEQANTHERTQLPADETPSEPQPQYVNRELKNITLQRALKQIRRELPLPDRLLSKVVHQKAIRAVSEASSKTITRPSGLLGGGLCAFLGSLAYLYLTKHIGLPYNYLLFSLLFVGGFVIGLVLEMLVRLLRPKRAS